MNRLLTAAQVEAQNARMKNTKEAEWCRKQRAADPKRFRAAVAKWQAKNPEKRKAIKKKFYHANREKMLETAATYRKNNPEKILLLRLKNKEKNKKWKEKFMLLHPDARRIWNHNRRAKIAEQGGRVSAGLVAKLFKLQRGKCACCKRSLNNDYLDHVVPISLGGANEDWNMQLLHSECNLNKGKKHPVVFMQERGFLL
ncbi:MAG: HNH endonuclease [Burkholderiales bacterium]